ncbi:MAG: response regulator transcription factor [Actinobacteria bacterium]|nr:response regulator transcription factor [Actinomycetota bacterium]
MTAEAVLGPRSKSSNGDSFAKPLKALLTYEHFMLLEGLAAAIHTVPGIEVVGIDTSPSNLPELTASMKPDIVVMSIEPPAEQVLESVRQLKEQCAEVAVVALCANPDTQLMEKSFGAGCSALLAKNHSVAQLAATMFAVSRGQVLFSLNESSRKSPMPPAGLTAREMEVLTLLAAGESTQSISDTLTLSPHTVRNHVKNLLAKLGAHSRLQAVAKAQQRQIIDAARPTS